MGVLIRLAHGCQLGTFVQMALMAAISGIARNRPGSPHTKSQNKHANITVLGISQDDKKKTQAFSREFGVTFPVALDEPKKYAVSNAYGLTNVPTMFYIAPGGEIEVSCVGWSKRDVEAIHQKLAEYRNQRAVPLWRSGDDVPDFRAG